MPSRILVFSELFYPHGSGAELATWLYSKLLANEGFKVTVVTTKFPGESSHELLSNGVEIYRIPMKMVLYGTRYYTLANLGVLLSSFINKLIKQNDVVYIPGGWYSVIPIAKINRKPVILHVHNYSLTCPTSLMYDFEKQKIGPSSLKSFIIHEMIERRRKAGSVVGSAFVNELIGKHYSRLGALADALIFVSHAQRNLVVSKSPHLRDKSYVIYNPIPDLPYIKAESKGIGYFGGKSFAKGFHILIKALKSIQNNNANITVFMTKISEKPYTIKLRNGVVVNLLPRVKSLEEFVNKIACTIIPSIWPEPLPYALIESMLHGKLIIASNIGGIPEIVAGASSGIKLTKPKDYNAIVDEIIAFHSLTLEEINELGFKNRAHILQKFDNSKTISMFIDTLNKVY
ncbi:MAG: glycosyltransferase family 4 protein [Thermosphaera sp.]